VHLAFPSRWATRPGPGRSRVITFGSLPRSIRDRARPHNPLLHDEIVLTAGCASYDEPGSRRRAIAWPPEGHHRRARARPDASTLSPRTRRLPAAGEAARAAPAEQWDHAARIR